MLESMLLDWPKRRGRNLQCEVNRENSREVTVDVRILGARDPWLMQGCPGVRWAGTLSNESLGVTGCEIEGRSCYHIMKYA